MRAWLVEKEYVAGEKEIQKHPHQGSLGGRERTKREGESRQQVEKEVEKECAAIEKEIGKEYIAAVHCLMSRSPTWRICTANCRMCSTTTSAERSSAPRRCARQLELEDACLYVKHPHERSLEWSALALCRVHRRGTPTQAQPREYRRGVQ